MSAMKETIQNLRKLVLQKMGPCNNRFSSDEVKKNLFAKHPNNQKRDSDTWESYLYKLNKIFIILSFNVGKCHDPALQTITLNGNNFLSVSLFIYDNNPIDIQTSKRNACNRLIEKINEVRSSNGIYDIMTKPERIIRNQEQETKKVGHVLDLYIRNTGNTWDIGQDLNSADALVGKVAAALNDLLPVAQFYADNWENLLS